MEDIREFITGSLGKNFSSIVDIKESEDGFYSRWIKPNGDFKYEIYIPENKMKLSFFTKLTIRHEIGHIIFNELFYNNHTKLTKIMDKILQYRILFFLQGIWYWNPIIRKIKKKLGFSTTINYKKDDLYDPSVSKMYTRRCNEYFCDYFALIVRKNINFLLDM